MDKRIAEFEGSPAAQHVAELLIGEEERLTDDEGKLPAGVGGKLAETWIRLINCKKNMLEGGVKDEGKQGSIIDAIKGLAE